LIINYLFTISQVSQTPSTTGTPPQTSHILVKHPSTSEQKVLTNMMLGLL